MQTKQPYPDSIRKAPELDLGLGLYMQAFLDLDSSRLNGMSMGRIPWLTIYDYCDRIEVVGDQRIDLIYCVQALDAWYVEWHREKDGKGKG